MPREGSDTHLCDVLKFTWMVEFCITKSRQFHVLDNFGILSRTQWCCCPDIPSGTTMPDFPPVHHSPGNWRPIIRETDSSSVSSSSENVSQKSAKFEEDRCTYSSKASQIVSPTFGFGDNDTEWSKRFLDRDLYIKDLHPWCQKSRQGWSTCPRYNTSSDSWEDSDKSQGLLDAARKLRKTAYLCDSHAQDPSVVLLFVVTGRICVTKLVLFVKLHRCVSP